MLTGVNSILYSLKQIPLIGRLFPETLYQVYGLKIFANILSVIWEVGFGVSRKISVSGADGDRGGEACTAMCPRNSFFFHILVFLSVIGAFTNTYMFNPSKDKYYAVILMRMDARGYALATYGYAILKIVAGFLPLRPFFLAPQRNVPVWMCLLIPFFIAGPEADRGRAFFKEL